MTLPDGMTGNNLRWVARALVYGEQTENAIRLSEMHRQTARLELLLERLEV